MRLTALLSVLICLCASAFAQDATKYEVFGGFTYQRAEPSAAYIDGYHNFYGWDAQLSANIRKNLALTVDVSKAHSTNIAGRGNLYNSHSIAFGPTYEVHRGNFTPFAHALFGVDHAAVTLGYKWTDDAMALIAGGGLDWNLRGPVSIRTVQLDWVRTNHANSWQDNYRASTGVVVRF